MKPLRSGLFAAMLVLAGCSTVAHAPRSAMLAPQDLDFVTTAYQLVHFDLDACAFVKKNPLEPQAVGVVDKICADAAYYAPRLRDQAGQAGVALPDALPLDLKARLVTLNYHPRPNLTVAFLNAEIGTHERALAVFRNEMRVGANPSFRRLAKKTMPLISRNLAMLRQALPNGTAE